MKNATCKMQRNLAFKNACKSIHICCFERHAWEQGKLLIKSTHTIVYNKVHVAHCAFTIGTTFQKEKGPLESASSF